MAKKNEAKKRRKFASAMGQIGGGGTPENGHFGTKKSQSAGRAQGRQEKKKRR